MITSSLSLNRAESRRASELIADYLELLKPRIAVLVLITVVVAGWVAAWGNPNPWMLLHAAIGTAFVAASAGAFNQWLEKDVDSLMRRTENRPLPAGRLTSSHVLVFGWGTLVLGSTYLAYWVNWQTAGWGLLTWMLYVVTYTPLKRITSFNTAVGALSGAIPVLMGWSAVGGEIGLRAVAMFSVLFLWQFPHFMAIAWLYREQYSRAGMRMLTVVDPSGQAAGVQAVIGALALLPFSFVPALFVAPPAGALYVAIAFPLGVGQLVCAMVFFALRSDASARLLLRASLIYLPLLWLLLILVPLL